MKKFFHVALVALTVVFMASCASGGSKSYKQGDPEPAIDYEKGTVNGIAYDNETECCWKTDVTAHLIVTVKTTSYEWGTQFAIKASNEYAAWMAAQTGYTSWKYNCVKAAGLDYDACMDENAKAK